MRRSTLVASALAASAVTAHAGRPLATEDAGVADTGTCFVEAWHERSKPEVMRQRDWLATLACGPLAVGFKFGSGWSREGGGSWSRSSAWALGIATLEPAANIAVHVNLGTARDTRWSVAFGWYGL